MAHRLNPESIVQCGAVGYPTEEITLPDCTTLVTRMESRVSCRIKLDNYEEFEKAFFKQSCISGERVVLEVPTKTVWKYPEWVWWTPKQENEKYYRFLKIGKEEYIQEKIVMENCVVKVINMQEGFADVEIYPEVCNIAYHRMSIVT